MEYEQRVEKIKSTILKKMGLGKPPKRTKSKNDIPNALLEEFQYDIQMREEAEKKRLPTSKVIALAQNGKKMCDLYMYVKKIRAKMCIFKSSKLYGVAGKEAPFAYIGTENFQGSRLINHNQC